MDRVMIKKMMDLGIEADKILALVMDSSEEAEKKQPEPEPEQKQPEPEQKQPEEKPAAAPANQDAVLAAIEKLTGIMAAGNIRRDGYEKQAETADDILAKVLLKNPEEDKKK